MEEREVQLSAVPQPGQRKNMDPVKGPSTFLPGRFANDCIALRNDGGLVAEIRNAYSGDTKLFFLLYMGRTGRFGSSVWC